MNYNAIMESVYRRNNFCSAGDLALELSRRYPQWQGNFYQKGVEFLVKKKKEKEELRISKIIEEERKNGINELAEDLACEFKKYNVRYHLHLPKEDNNIVKLEDAFNKIGL